MTMGIGFESTIYGTQNDDVLIGTSGDDMIYTYNGNDAVFGGKGQDTILDVEDCSISTGTRGTLKMFFGGAGDDFIFSDGTNAGSFNGGAGNDTFGVGMKSFAIINGGKGEDTIGIDLDTLDVPAGYEVNPNVVTEGNKTVVSLDDYVNNVHVHMVLKNFEHINFYHGHTPPSPPDDMVF